jgi:hypothetical protein
LFLRCPFAKNCWPQIGVHVLSWLRPERDTRHIKRALQSSSLCNVDHHINVLVHQEGKKHVASQCRRLISDEMQRHIQEKFAMVIHRTKSSVAQDIEMWLQNLN